MCCLISAAVCWKFASLVPVACDCVDHFGQPAAWNVFGPLGIVFLCLLPWPFTATLQAAAGALLWAPASFCLWYNSTSSTLALGANVRF